MDKHASEPRHTERLPAVRQSRQSASHVKPPSLNLRWWRSASRRRATRPREPSNQNALQIHGAPRKHVNCSEDLYPLPPRTVESTLNKRRPVGQRTWGSNRLPRVSLMHASKQHCVHEICKPTPETQTSYVRPVVLLQYSAPSRILVLNLDFLGYVR